MFVQLFLAENKAGYENGYKYVGCLNNRGLHPCRAGEADVEKEILDDGLEQGQLCDPDPGGLPGD